MGEKLTEPAAEYSPDGAEYAIEAFGLSRFFGTRAALHDVSVKVASGSVCGLLGPNGSGKTTLIRILVGHLRPTSGEARVLGRTFAEDPLGIRRRLGYVSDTRYLYDWMSVREILGFTRSFHEDWDQAKAEHLLTRFSLPLDRKISQLSRGHRARLSLTLALAYNPELIVLDELTSGLDPLIRREVLENLIEEISQEGRTVLFSSHSAEEVERLADHVVILQDGRRVIDSLVESLKRSVVQMRFGRTPDAARLTGPGLLSVRQLGPECLVTVRDYNPGTTCEAMNLVGSEPEIVPLTLEEIFIELLRARQHEPGRETPK